MSRREKYYLTYTSMMIGSVAAFLFTEYGGIFSCFISAIGITLSRTIVFLFLSFLNFSLSLAFDNFIRVDPVFYFYDGSGVNASYLCMITTLIYCTIGILDISRPTREKEHYLIKFKFPKVSPLLFWPLTITTLCVSIFVLKNESFVLSSKYDAYELRKYPFLEYVSLIIAFMIHSAKPVHRRVLVAYGVAMLYILTCLATSYRMVAIVCMLSMFMMFFNGKRLIKSYVILCWIFAYTGLTYISYWRIGHFDISLANIFGYHNGRMDNTFTGVIETSLIYTSIGETQSALKNFLFMIGALLPIPNSLIPDDMLYIVDAMKTHHFPGGGALSGFVIYFNYIYFIPYLIYLYIAFMWSHKGGLASGMYLIVFVTITRWWLYGPYVIFKFLGVLILLLGINLIAKKLSREINKNRGAGVGRKDYLRLHQSY